MSIPWNNKKLIFPKKPYKCGYCGKNKTIPYNYVDGEKSCQRCNRAYSDNTPDLVADCPICKGRGYLPATKELT